MEVKSGYKLTDVGIIPSDWQDRSIKSVAKLINGRGFKPTEWKKDGLPIIRIQNLNGSDEFNYFQGSYDKKLEIENGQLLFAWSGSRGTSFGPHIWKGTKGLLNYHTWKVVVNENEVQRKFFLHALKQLTKFIEDKAHGASALVHTQKWEMEEFKFPMPSSEFEQTAIANALSDTDALIGSLQKLIAKKRQIKQGAMQTLLNPYEDGVLKLGWEEKKLGDSATLKARIGWQGLTTAEYKDEGDYFLVTGTEFKNGYIDWDSCFYVDQVRYKQDRNIQLKANDILVTKDGTIGKVAFINHLPIPATLNSGVFVIRPNNNEFHPAFFYYLLLSEHFKNFLSQLSAGSTINHLYQKDFVHFVFRLPKSIQEQKDIAIILSHMDEEISALESKLVKYQQIKQGMMQNLLTGRIRLA